MTNDAAADNGTPVEMETATLQIPKVTLDFLRDAAKKRGVSTGDMVRIALGTQEFLSKEVDKGATVQLKRNTGTFDVNFS